MDRREGRLRESHTDVPSMRRAGAGFLRAVASSLDAPEGTLTVLFCKDAEMAELNRAWRGKPRPTDVLSFEGHAGTAAGAAHVGDLAISLDTAARQARRARRSIGSEIEMLLTHGVLHLMGYDHETDDGTMMRLQARTLAAVRPRGRRRTGARRTGGRRAAPPEPGPHDARREVRARGGAVKDMTGVSHLVLLAGLAAVFLILSIFQAAINSLSRLALARLRDDAEHGLRTRLLTEAAQPPPSRLRVAVQVGRQLCLIGAAVAAARLAEVLGADHPLLYGFIGVAFVFTLLIEQIGARAVVLINPEKAFRTTLPAAAVAYLPLLPLAEPLYRLLVWVRDASKRKDEDEEADEEDVRAYLDVGEEKASSSRRKAPSSRASSISRGRWCGR
jgi:probable rRNA maturation factor